LVSQKKYSVLLYSECHFNTPLPQFLISFNNLLKPSVVGAKGAKPLNPKQKETIQGFIKRAEELLEKIAPKGHRFLKSTRHVLQREENWKRWKDIGDGKERCPALSIRLFLKTDPTSKADLKTYIDVEGGDTVAGIKAKIADKVGIDASEQTLALLRTNTAVKPPKTTKITLADEKYICDYEIQSKSVILVTQSELVLPMPPMRKRAVPQDGGGGKRINMGNKELTRLWNAGSTELDELTECSIPELRRCSRRPNPRARLVLATAVRAKPTSAPDRMRAAPDISTPRWTS
jgi:hypothetical protein